MIFRERLPEPLSYFHGADGGDRIRARNDLVFLRTSRSALQQSNFANRVHHRYVLVLVLKTPGKVSLDGERYALQPGDALLVLPFQFHHYINLADNALRWLLLTFELDEGAAASAVDGPWPMSA